MSSRPRRGEAEPSGGTLVGALPLNQQQPPTLALAGGLLAADSPLRAALDAALKARVGDLPRLERDIDAARGAALLAMDAE